MTRISDPTTDNVTPIDPKKQSWTVMVNTSLDKKLGVGFHEDGVVISFYEASGGDLPITMERVALSYEAFEALLTPSPTQDTPTN